MNHLKALQDGIRKVGVGRTGSSDLDAELITLVSEALRCEGNDAAKGAFLAGLWNKGVSSDERTLETVLPEETLSDPERQAEYVAKGAPDSVRVSCEDLCNGKTLSREQAREAGLFILSDEPGARARGFILSFLRVRYETPQEYAGMLDALTESINPDFEGSTSDGPPIIQLAEPFDGATRSFLLTPAIAHFLQDDGFRVVTLSGKSSGPKYGMNLHDIVNTLGLPFRKSPAELETASDYGNHFNLDAIIPAVNRTREIRQEIVKRPCLATIEKFVNPANAQTLIVSAAHPPYLEKMLTLAEDANFPSAIAICRGIEGSISFSLQRPVNVWATRQTEDGSYSRNEWTFRADELGFEPQKDTRHEDPSPKKNAELLHSLIDHPDKAPPEERNRLAFTLKGIRTALSWINQGRFPSQELD